MANPQVRGVPGGGRTMTGFAGLASPPTRIDERCQGSPPHQSRSMSDAY